MKNRKMQKLLIIDDDSRNIFALKAVLRTKGFDCISATGAGEGLGLLEADPSATGVVLMDMMMPEMDGYEAIGRIRADPRFDNLVLIAVTAQAMPGDREKAIAAGADDYLSKPVNVDVLLGMLGKYLK